jgi:hypothetical protein
MPSRVRAIHRQTGLSRMPKSIWYHRVVYNCPHAYASQPRRPTGLVKPRLATLVTHNARYSAAADALVIPFPWLEPSRAKVMALGSYYIGPSEDTPDRSGWLCWSRSPTPIDTALHGCTKFTVARNYFDNRLAFLRWRLALSSL